MVRVLTTKQFIARAKRIHGGKYDYSSTYYINMREEIKIKCLTHGMFLQLPGNHLKGAGCSGCNGGIQKTKEQFIKDAQLIHGDVYDYSKVEYINKKTKVNIFCRKHGPFLQTPDGHLNDKNGCPRCVSVGYSKISIQFLNDLAKEWKVEIQHAENKGEYRIDDPEFKCYYKADGYFEQNNKNICCEFHGDILSWKPKDV